MFSRECKGIIRSNTGAGPNSKKLVMNINFFLSKTEKVEMDSSALVGMLQEVAMMAVERVSNAFYSKKECIKLLDGRRNVELMVKRGILNPNTSGGKWKVYPHEVRSAINELRVIKRLGHENTERT